jgi:replication factor C subunit 2/4
MTIKAILQNACGGDLKAACRTLEGLWANGYGGIDIITTLFCVCKQLDITEERKLKWIREIGFTHMRIADGVCSLLQLTGLIARLCLCQ